MGNSREVAKDMVDMVNNMSFSSTDFVNEVTRSHRTLQQSVFRLFMDLLKEWSEMEANGSYDLRNEKTVKTAKLFIESYKEANHGATGVECI